MGLVSSLTRYSAGITAPDGWDATYRAALADVDTTPVRVAVIGDSFVQGLAASDHQADGYANLLRVSLNTRYGEGAYGRMPADSARFILTYVNPPFVVAAGVTWIAGPGLGHVPRWASGAPTDAIVYTSPSACTSLDIVYSDSISGSWTYSLDGGAPQTVTTAGTQYAKIVSLTGLANAVHTLNFSGVSANGALQISAVVSYQQRTHGIQFMRYGASSQQLGALTTESMRAWGGRAADAGAYDVLGFPTAPHLAVIAWGLNDCAFQSFTSVDSDPYATFRYRFQQLIGALRRGKNTSIALVINWNPDGVVSDVTAYFGNEDTWPRYRDIIHSVARQYRCAVVDVHDRWRELGGTNGYALSGNAHPTTAGHADIAAALLELI